MPSQRWTRRSFAIAMPTILLCACAPNVKPTGPTTPSPKPIAITPTVPSQPSPRPTISTVTTPAVDTTVAATALPTAALAPTVEPTATTPTKMPTSLSASPAAASETTQLIKHGVADLAKATLEGVQRVSGALVLDSRATGYQARGTITSPEIPASFAFDTLVPSWNASAPPGTSLRCEVRVLANQTWSDWYKLGLWSAEKRGSFSHQRDALGTVDVDTLKLFTPAHSFQYRFTLITDTPRQTPTVRLVAVNFANLRVKLSGSPVKPAPGWARDLAVPVQSQLLQAANLAWDVCSPTSLAMVLQYWKVSVSVPEVIDGVRDQSNGIYGNWPFNTAYAALRGLEAYVNRFTSIEDLQNEIAAGRPVVASIRFAAGELANAPIASASGHLLVVRGFTPAGDVIVNDPVAPNLTGVRRVYRRDQFANVWLNHGGVVYQVNAPVSHMSGTG